MASITRADLDAAFAEAVAPRVIEYATRTSAALSAFNVLPMSTATEKMPVLSALPTGGFLTADQDAKPVSKAEWDGVQLVAEEIAVIVPVSETAVADANFDVVAAVERLIGQEFGRIIDAALFFGTGAPASWPEDGLVGLAIAEAQTVTAGTGSATIADDLNALFAEVEAFSDVTDVFAARALKAQMRGQKDSNGVPIFNPNAGPAGVGEIYGVPVRYPLGWDATTATALAVDDAMVALAVRQDMTFKILTEATLTGFGNLAEKDSIAIRCLMRVAAAAANPVSVETGERGYAVAAYLPDATP